MLSAEEMQALQAYSNGEIGWREAGRHLPVTDHRELSALLRQQGLPEPEPDTAPMPEQTLARFDALLQKGAE